MQLHDRPVLLVALAVVGILLGDLAEEYAGLFQKAGHAARAAAVHSKYADGADRHEYPLETVAILAQPDYTANINGSTSADVNYVHTDHLNTPRVITIST